MNLISTKSLCLEMIGFVQAGKTIGWPNPAEEETRDTVDISELFNVNELSSKIFRVSGDSLEDDGIYEQDILLVECTDKYKVGDLVIAEIDGDEMVKYYMKDKNGKAYLQAANSRIGKIYPQEYLKVKAVVRSIHRVL